MYVQAGNHINRLIALLDIVGVVFCQVNGGRIVYPELFRSREADGGRLLKITDDILLKLKKSSVLEREFLVRTYSNGIPVHTYMSGPYLEDDLYHDEASMASVTVSYDSGIRVEGIVTPRMRIAPLSTQKRSSDGRVAHQLIEIQDELTSDSGDYEVAAYPTTRTFNGAMGRNESIHISERSSETIRPELFVVVDSLFARVFSSTANIIKYVAICVNAINLRYLGVTDPKVKHKLVGLEVTTAEQEWFLRRVTRDPRYVHAQGTLASFKTYVTQNRELYNNADAVFLLTGQDLATIKNYEVNNRTGGYAYIRTVCSEHKVGVGEDRPPTFKGVHVMAHEIGHILGCLHDGEDSPFPNQDIPGSRECPFEHGYLMSYIRKDSNTYKFSPCSIQQIRETARSQSGSCLHVLNNVRTLLKRYKYLPGQMMTRTQQCQNAFPTEKNVEFIAEMGVKDCTIRCGNAGKKKTSEYKLLVLSDGTPCKKKRGKTYNVIEMAEMRVEMERKNDSVNKNCINGLCLKMKKSYGYEAVP